MSKPIIYTHELTKFYGRPSKHRPAVHGISVEIQQGEIVALLGRNGAGKSTFIKMLLGHESPSWGSSFLFGEDSMHLSPGIMSKTGYMAEDHPLIDWMTVGRLAAFTRDTFLNWSKDRFEQLAAELKLDSNWKIRSLSRGQRAQVALAINFACQPELLILDDPTLGLDVAVHRDFIRELVNLVSEEGKTVLLSTHNLRDVGRMADRLLILQEGVLRADIQPEVFSKSFTELHFKSTRAMSERPDHAGILRIRQDERSLSIVVRSENACHVRDWALDHAQEFEEENALDMEELFILYTEPEPMISGVVR